jgi:pyridoxamine 5'-phosphate oxidase
MRLRLDSFRQVVEFNRMSLRARIYSLKGLLLGLHESVVDRDPLAQFDQWYGQARWTGLPMPDSFTLATVAPDGKPDARMLLLKGVDEKGFVFYTNYESRKADEIAKNPNATMVFHWNELFRQVRVEGRLEKVTAQESDAYFQSRLRGSRIGAWASKQSSVISNREELEAKVREIELRYKGQPIPCPPFWGGFRLIPERIEFWQGRPSRLHDRLCFVREGSGWKMLRLSP